VKPSLHLRIGHQLTMTPQLQQAIRLLQLSSLDLQTEIDTLLETNTMLEYADPAQESLNEQSEDDEEKEDEKEDEDIHPLEQFTIYSTQSENNAYSNLETLNHVPPTTLKDHLVWQMQLTSFSDSDKLIAATLIDAMNDEGFLIVSVPDIVATLSPQIDVKTNEVEAVLHRIQQFEPSGVGARNLSECLKIQLNQRQHVANKHKIHELIQNHLGLLAKRDYTALRRRLGVSASVLNDIIRVIQSFNPKPGTQIGSKSSPSVIPDVIAYKTSGKWQVELNPACTPVIQINRQYAALTRQCHNQADTQFLKSQLQEARWFLKSIENRNETLLKVAQCIIEHQSDFLEHGEQAMKPLILQDIAHVLQLHESTISRITTQKYMTTPRGTFELKYFFSSHLSTQQGTDCSATAIRALLKKLISAEDKGKPLSDSKLAKMLINQGINIARRTVAKYREEMLIPPSNERKRPFIKL